MTDEEVRGGRRAPCGSSGRVAPPSLPPVRHCLDAHDRSYPPSSNHSAQLSEMIEEADRDGDGEVNVRARVVEWRGMTPQHGAADARRRFDRNAVLLLRRN